MPSANWPQEACVAKEPDLQGRVVVHSLEYTIVYQCTNRCRGCNHFTFIQPKHCVSVSQFRQDLEALTKIAHCDKFSLIGGECLLHPNIVELLDIVNEVKIGDLVSLTSNGQLFERYADELWSRLQRVEFGLYAGKWSVSSMTKLMNTVERWDLPAFFGLVGPHEPALIKLVETRVGKNPQWRHVVNTGFHPTLTRETADDQEAQRRFSRCLYGHVCVTLDQGYLFRCPESSFVPSLLLGQDRCLDGKKLEGMKVDDFRQFVLCEQHLHSCHRCCSLENYFPWCEVAESTSKEEWLKLAMGNV